MDDLREEEFVPGVEEAEIEESGAREADLKEDHESNEAAEGYEEEVFEGDDAVEGEDEAEEEALDEAEDSDKDEPVFTGEFADLARKNHEGKLEGEDIDRIADLSLEVIRSVLSAFDAADSSIDEYEGRHGELIFDIVNPDLAVLIGRHGKTLEAFQVIVSTLVNKRLGFKFPIVVDVEGYKNRRKEKLTSLAQSCANKAVRGRRPVKLHPMPAYERRMIHLALRHDKRVTTFSEGDEPDRRVVIQAKPRY